MTKLKLTTTIHRGVSREQQSQPAFLRLLTFLPELYAAQLSPQEWNRSDSPTIQDEYLFSNFERFKHFKQVLKHANRIEMRITLPQPRRKYFVQGVWVFSEDEPGAWLMVHIQVFFRGGGTPGALCFDLNVVSGLFTVGSGPG